MRISGLATAVYIGTLLARPVAADVCDYRLSNLVSGFGSGVIAGTAGSTAAAGTAMHATGFYTLVHAGSGLTMLGSTAGGASAAGTVGIMGGTGGLIGTTAGVLMSPVVIGGAAIAAIGTASFEGACYFRDERITQYDDVLAALGEIVSADDETVRLVQPDPDNQKAHLSLRQLDKTWITYQVEDLYIVNGELMHRDWLLNTRIGSIKRPNGEAQE